MVISDLLLLKKLNIGILSFTGFVTLITGMSIFFPAVYSDPPRELQSNILNHSIDSVSGSEKRMPSSLGVLPAISSVLSVAETPKIHAKPIDTLALGCLTDGLKIVHVSESRNIRLKARICGGLKFVSEKSGIINRTNGFEATLFDLSNGEISSDLISLSEGENNIWVQFESSNGETYLATVTISKSTKP